ncbi:MAG: nucleoside triphosphate pyrophosphohydrolase [Patescibacteria group bacterium]
MSQLTRIYYNKLVRDHTKEKIEKKGHKCDIRPISDIQEFQQELFKKIREEATSLSMTRTKEDFLEEYCDMMEVLDAILEQLEIDEATVQAARDANHHDKGGYKHRHFLHWSDDVQYKSEETPQGIPL